jgi:hypothetical protein
LLELLLLLELFLLELLLLFEPELELFLAPPDFEAALAITLSLMARINRPRALLFQEAAPTPVCSPIVLIEQMRYTAAFWRGSAADLSQAE